jgi:hypothetical protein
MPMPMPHDIQYLNFRDFPFATCVIKIPKNICFFRTGNNDPAKETAPRWFSDHINASSYFTMYPKMFVCCGKEDFKVLDIRLMKYTVLEALLENAQVVDSLKGSPTTAKLQECIQAFMKVFGFVPGKEQYGSDSHNRPFPFSAYGYRWSDNSVDNKAVALLKYIFYPHIQGYIAPMLKRHDTTLFHQELCLFVPSSVLAGPSVIIPQNEYEDTTGNLIGKKLELSPEFMVMDGGGGGRDQEPGRQGNDQGNIQGPVQQGQQGNVQGQQTFMGLTGSPAASHTGMISGPPSNAGLSSSGPSSTIGSPSGPPSTLGSPGISRQPSINYVFQASATALAKIPQVKGYQLSCNDNLCSECNDNIVFNSEELGVLELIKNSVMSQIII